MASARSSRRPTGSARSPAAPSRPNSIGMSPRDLGALLDELDGNPGPGSDPRRGFVRWPFRRESIPLELSQPGGGSPQRLAVACRNLSRGGMSVLHGAYCHVGSRCRVTLPHPSRGDIGVDGFVTRCAHVRSMVHEIGIRFNTPIDAREFVEMDPLIGCFAIEHVDPELLEGSILHVEQSATERRIVRHHLRASRLTFRKATDVESAVALAKDRSDDACICNADAGGTWGGIEIVRALRAAGMKAPIIMVASESDRAARRRMSEAGANAFVLRPVQRDVLMRALAEFLLLDRKGDPLVCALPAGDPRLGQTEEAVRRVRAFAQRLEQMTERDDPLACRALCAQIRDACPAICLTSIAQMADLAARTLNASQSVSESIREIRGLIAACKQARTRAE
jgi:CheY-like chemotaxis protein